jgi:hypothetical protein
MGVLKKAKNKGGKIEGQMVSVWSGLINGKWVRSLWRGLVLLSMDIL